MDSGKIVIGALAGIALGATLGILFAPDKGSETRKKLSAKGLDITDELKDKLNGILDNLVDKYEKVKSDISEFAELGKSKLEAVEKEVRTTHV